ncbi:MAG: M1 family metallopeptidase [Saprospiraceae bacterium]|nr:M1 family metallopeptidase [Saprospiraceae bacterium]MDW8229496.1 M1 family metallopeptidase [Saprospiraceae bacterium]
MRTLFLSLLGCLCSTAAFGQTPYFQQEVHYRIRVALDDTKHTLQGHVRMEYINHAPDALTEIWIHLWPNAYQNRRTAFCRQQLRLGKAEFYFAPDSSLGYIRQLDFQVNGRAASWQYHPEHTDIARVALAEPLPPGGRVVVETPFLVKIPATFSRIGHKGQAYQVTQWYPKPAVYDARGWHPMPYLDMGEFYSEFGSFDVEITLPENYVVGATGVLQSPEERAFLLRRVAETQAALARLDTVSDTPRRKRSKVEDEFPPSSPTLKTLRYWAERVHDFAWFADKRFYVLRDTARLASGREVECWAMFPPSQGQLWQRAAFYVRRAVEFYSEQVGEYPWPQATAVQSALSAGGGMEYPMITVIGDADNAESLDEVIAHEVGHNWFYGILASNERDYPWMDEGLNTYYEHRYMEAYYGKSEYSGEPGKRPLSSQFFGTLPEMLLTLFARIGDVQTPSSPERTFNGMGYWANAYAKPVVFLRWVEQSVGRPLFDRAMKHYYQQWQFRHPHPEDLRAAWKEVGLEADWFFKAMESARVFDVALRRAQRQPDGGWEIWVKNRGAQRGPFRISALKSGRVVHEQWYPAFRNALGVVTFPNVEVDAFEIDRERATLDAYRANNRRRVGGLSLSPRPLLLRPVVPFEAANYRALGLLPWLAWNQYDKTTVGLALYSPLLPPQRFRYYLMPGIGTASGNIVGLADVQYRFLPGGLVPHATLGFNVRSATYAHRLGEGGYRLQYWRWAPALRLDLRSASSAFAHGLDVRAIFLQKEEPTFSDQGVFAGKRTPAAQIYEARYEAQNFALPNPYRAFFALEGQRYSVQGVAASYLRASAAWEQEFLYKPKKRIYARFFGGYFLHNTQRRRGNVATNSLTNDVARASFALNPQGFNDYRFDQIFLGRTDTRGFLARQVSQTEGGFKNALGPAYAQVFGNSNDFIAALNLRADLPVSLLFKPYFDIGYFRDATPLGASRPLEEQLVWSGGLMLEILRGRFEMYFPLVHSAALRQLYASATDNYWQRITWSIRIAPIRVRDREQMLRLLD